MAPIGSTNARLPFREDKGRECANSALHAAIAAQEMPHHDQRKRSSVPLSVSFCHYLVWVLAAVIA